MPVVLVYVFCTIDGQTEVSQHPPLPSLQGGIEKTKLKISLITSTADGVAESTTGHHQKNQSQKKVSV